MIRTLLAINDHRVADHISGLVAESEELESAGWLRDPQELRGALPRSDIDAIVMHDRRGALSLIEIVRELTVAHPDVGLVLIVSEDSPEVLRSGMQAGARDVIATPVGLEQLEMSLLAAASWTQALRRRAGRDSADLLGVGRVLTVVGAKGGVGTSTVAVHLALAAREIGAASVALVEYDLQGGDLRAFLDLPYRRSVADLATVADELTTRHLQEAMYTHASGMRVLLAPQEGEHAEGVTAAAARSILTAIRTREDLTIVDAGATLSEASAIAVEMADTTLVVTTPDVVSLRGVVRLCSLWNRLKVEPADVAVLLNRTSRKLEVQPDLARRVVPIPVLQTNVPADFFALESAVNTGIPATAGASRAMLEPMAGVLGEVSALPAAASEGRAPERSKSIAARFAGESGQATIETVGVLPLLLLLLIVLWQIALVGLTFVFSGHAARAGARAFAVGDPVRQAALGAVPGVWAGDSTQVTQQQPKSTSDPQDIEGSVTVSMCVPVIVPGLGCAIRIPTTAHTVLEEQALANERPNLSILSGGSFGPGSPPRVAPHFVRGKIATIFDPPGGGPPQATVPTDLPQAVQWMIEAANDIVTYPYCWGGGHVAPNFWPDSGSRGDSGIDECLGTSRVGYDCSGAVLWVLHNGIGYDIPGGSSSLVFHGDLGAGQYVTIEANNDHVRMQIAGLDFEAIGARQGIGPTWYPVGQLAMSGGPYTTSHPPNL
ncbi:MAG TPA: P-loop NTPase [Solirubrobacteraceae bacterium]|nr:P-loop NTPase [Solirubrobacteraceae bacterium]